MNKFSGQILLLNITSLYLPLGIYLLCRKDTNLLISLHSSFNFKFYFIFTFPFEVKYFLQ